MLAAGPASAEPFLTRDQNLLLGGSALPLPVPADLAAKGSTRFDLAANWSSTASSGLTADEALLVDVESREVRLFLEHTLSERYAVRVQVPYRQLTTGILDGFIDGWHRALGLPEGARKFLERDQFQIGYLRGSGTVLNRREPLQGFGDIVLEGGFQAWKSMRTSGAVWISLEAPTGSETRLLGNGTWDAGVRLAGRNDLSARNTAYWQLGATRVGRSGALAEWQNDWAFSGTGTYEFAATPALRLKAQVDVHSALYKSGVDFLGEAAILTVGGEFRFDSGLRLEIGIGEDIKVGASPDVNFCFALRQPL
jgi:hypothetical protein